MTHPIVTKIHCFIILLSATSAACFAQNPTNSALIQRIDADRGFDRQATIQNWVNPGVMAKAAEKQEEIKPAFEISAQYQYDDNAFHNRTNRSDWMLGYSAMATLTGIKLEALAIKPFVQIGGDHYDKFSDLSDNYLSAGLTLEPMIKSDHWGVAFTYSSDWYYSEGFDEQAVAFHTPGVRLGYRTGFLKDDRFPNGRLLWSVLGSANYQFCEEESLKCANFTGATKIQYRITDRLTALGSAGITYRTFSNSTPLDRDQWRVKLGAALNYVIIRQVIPAEPVTDGKGVVTQGEPTINDILSAKVGIDYTHSDDKIEVLDYDQTVVFGGLTLTF